MNERHGDDHGVNLTQLRAVAKRLGKQQDLALELWGNGDTAARLLALLICRPKSFERDELDAMVRETVTPKVHDWFVNYVVKKPEGLDLAGLLDVIETEMGDASERLQWAMNTCLAQIGIEHPEHRARALEIGERLEVLKDYPTPPNCTSPYAPAWIAEMVRRQDAP